MENRLSVHALILSFQTFLCVRVCVFSVPRKMVIVRIYVRKHTEKMAWLVRVEVTRGWLPGQVNACSGGLFSVWFRKRKAPTIV